MSESAFEKNKSVGEFHRFSDVDSSWHAQHHTLGAGVNQAAPGNHTHDGSVSKRLTGASIEDFSMQSPAVTPIEIDLSTLVVGAVTAPDSMTYDAVNDRVTVVVSGSTSANFEFGFTDNLVDKGINSVDKYIIEIETDAIGHDGYIYAMIGDADGLADWIYLNDNAYYLSLTGTRGFIGILMHPDNANYETQLNGGVYEYFSTYMMGGSAQTFHIYSIKFYEISGYSFKSDGVEVIITKAPNAVYPKYMELVDVDDIYLSGTRISWKVDETDGNATRLVAFNLKQYSQTFFNRTSTINWESSYNYFKFTSSIASGTVTILFSNIPAGATWSHYYLEINNGITSISWPAGTKFAGGVAAAPSGRTLYELIGINGQVIVNRVMTGITV